MATASRFNRGYRGGLAAGSQPGGGFKSNLPPMGFGTPAPMPGMKPPKTPQELALEEMNQPLDMSFQPPAAAQAPPPAAPDMNNFFGPAPLPGAGQQSFSQPPASPFGPAPLPEFGGFRARGGPVLPGRAYMVGERGPEMIVPQTPGMVIPNGAVPSPMNRGYAPGSLAGRGPVPVGRGIDDPARQSERLNRIARQQFGQTGDPSLMLSMNWRNRMGPAPAPTPAFTPPLPMAPAAAAPTGRLVPGISAGSMVWQPDATALPVPMMAEEPPPTFGPVPSAPTAPPPLEFGPPSQPLRGMPGTFDPALLPWELPMQTPKAGGFGVTGLMPDPNKGAFNPQAPLAASPLAHYTPPPPALDFRPLPGNPGYGAPVVNGQVQKQFLPLPPPDAPLPANFQPESATRGGVRYAPPVTAKDSKSPDFTFEKDDMGRITGGVYPVQDENGKWRLQRVDINGDGKIAPAEAAKAAAAATAPAAAPVKVPSGNSFRPVQ